MSSRLIPPVVLGALLTACAPESRPQTPEPAAAAVSCPAGPTVAPTVPPSLQAPAGATLAMRLHAEGAQVYVCKASTPGMPFAWTLKAPDARLYDDSCKQVGTHFGGPTWQSSVDGSSVVGAKVADAPSNGTIPWLLLKAQTNAGAGVFSHITAVQRVDTAGGVAPGSGCDAAADGKEQAVPYSANYYFYAGTAL
jgi:hypothetical protein